MKLNLGSLVLLLAVIILVAWEAAGQGWNPWRIAGVAIMAPAFLLFLAARLQLGSAFSVQAKASTLVTAGIYSRIRHPIYVFGGLFIAGALVWMQRPWWLLIFALLIPLQLFRVHKEEQVLEAKFGAAYLEYRRKTWF